MEKKSNCTLICDTREKHVTRHQNEFFNISMEIKQITTGDYAVLSPNNNILATIERKSLEDFAASLKDGRMSNTQKMINLRNETGCRIIYIIEGPAFPSPDNYFGNIPYKHIESAIFHMMVRDNVTVLRSDNSLGTAKLLSRFVLSMDSLCRSYGEFIGGEPVNLNGSESPAIDNDSIKVTGDKPIEQIINNSVVEMSAVAAMLTTKHEKSDTEVARGLWSCFPGISTESASEYMKYWSIADIVCERIPRGDITKFKLASGRAIGKKAANSLCGINKIIEVRLLSTIPGISTAMATWMLDANPLKRLLSYGKEISIEIVGKNSRRLGDKLAEKVVKYFNYKLT